MATIKDLEGGAELCAWFEGIPSFHDATLREVELRQGGPGRLIAGIFRIENKVDAEGRFLLTKHARVTLTIHDLIEVQLFDFMEAGIMSGLDIGIDSGGISLAFDSSYGVHGKLKAKRIVVSFQPQASE